MRTFYCEVLEVMEDKVEVLAVDEDSPEQWHTWVVPLWFFDGILAPNNPVEVGDYFGLVQKTELYPGQPPIIKFGIGSLGPENVKKYLTNKKDHFEEFKDSPFSKG